MWIKSPIHEIDKNTIEIRDDSMSEMKIGNNVIKEEINVKCKKENEFYSTETNQNTVSLMEKKSHIEENLYNYEPFDFGTINFYDF